MLRKSNKMFSALYWTDGAVLSCSCRAKLVNLAWLFQVASR
uniref:Uncharacterized protein n=1 Tax=Arundo donax TaxID=35708 RepID=A0A0A9EJP4_ARUDO